MRRRDIHLTEMDDGRTFTVAAGDRVVVELPSSADATGHRWFVVAGPELIGDPKYPLKLEDYAPGRHHETFFFRIGEVVPTSWSPGGWLRLVKLRALDKDFELTTGNKWQVRLSFESQ
jgi:hypothetical protein